MLTELGLTPGADVDPQIAAQAPRAPRLVLKPTVMTSGTLPLQASQPRASLPGVHFLFFLLIFVFFTICQITSEQELLTLYYPTVTMPTLVEVETTCSQQESMGESTARPSELLWMKNEFRASASATEDSERHHLGDDASLASGDSTLSGTLLMEAMEEMRRMHQMRKNQRTTQQETIDDGTYRKTLNESMTDEFQQQQPLSPSKHDRNEMSGSLHEKQLTGNANTSSALDTNDTFSRTMHESYFERMSSQKQDNETPTRSNMSWVKTNENKNDLSEHTHNDALSRTLNESYFDRQLSQKSPVSKSLKVSFTIPHRVDRKPGPMEQLYTNKYKEKIRQTIRSFQLSHPGKINDYGSMSPTQREKEQRHVLALLQRLKIAPLSSQEDDRPNPNELSCMSSKSQRYLKDDDKEMRLEEVKNSMQDLSDTFHSASHSRDETMEKSVALLSPPTDTFVEGPSNSMASHNSNESQDHKQSPVSKPESPIEMTRAAVGYRSPADDAERIRKRLASMSGKRGADQTRPRLEQSAIDWVEMHSYHETPSRTLEELDCSLARSGENKIFTASASPISPDGSGPVTPGAFSSDHNISFGEEASDKSPRRTSSDSIEESMIQGRRVHWNIHGTPLRSLTANVHLKDGKTAHFLPLDVEYNRRERRAPPTQSFPDPFVGYSNRTHRRLGRLYKWIRSKDAVETGQGLVLSLKSGQLMDMVRKMLLDDHPIIESATEPTEMQGKTLIVARSKEDLLEWSRMLREGSALSVLNHSTLPLKERKAHATIAKCSHYDVVLTTFDAMKAPDSNIPLDGKGIASVKDQQRDDEWYTSRSQSESLQCKQLSVLHQLHWRRILFADILGKKCFLAKPGTSRHSAAVAFSSKSRFVFVLGSPEKGASLTTLVKTNKDALLSMAAVLQLENASEANVLEHSLADFHDSSSYR